MQSNSRRKNENMKKMILFFNCLFSRSSDMFFQVSIMRGEGSEEKECEKLCCELFLLHAWCTLQYAVWHVGCLKLEFCANMPLNRHAPGLGCFALQVCAQRLAASKGS
jgi:hypothetical protein